MSVTKQFDCSECKSFGKVILRGDEIEEQDIVFCPVCGRDIYEDDETLYDDIDEDDDLDA